MNKFWLPLLLFLGLGVAQAAAPLAPDAAVKETTEKMRALIRENHVAYNADKAAFYKVVDEVLVPRFDIRRIAQLVLGKSWRTATEDQRTRFQNAFKKSLIRNYADALLEYYDSVEAEFQPLRLAAGADDATVRCVIKRKDGPPISLSFSMNEVNEEWKVYDITIENLSLVTNFRSQYAVEVKKNGLDALIQRVEKGQTAKVALKKAG